MPSKSPVKAAIQLAIRRCYQDLHRLEIILAERQQQVQDSINLVIEANHELRRLKESLADHAEALAALEAAERMERRQRAA